MNNTDSDILIIKHRPARYTVIDRRITDGQTGLSLRATGLLCHLLGKPDSWKTWSRQLAKHWRCSKTVILAILKELRHAGYAKLDVKRDERGRLGGKFWRISDMPEFGTGTLESAQNAIKTAPSTDGLLSRLSEKSEHRKRSPIQNTDFWTEKLKETEEGGVPPPGPSLLLRSLFKSYAETYEDRFGRCYSPNSKDAAARLATEVTDLAAWQQLLDWIFAKSLFEK